MEQVQEITRAKILIVMFVTRKVHGKREFQLAKKRIGKLIIHSMWITLENLQSSAKKVTDLKSVNCKQKGEII
jgi:hypothetical protein